MKFDPETAAIRFGTGLSPWHEPPRVLDDVLGEISGRDRVARDLPVPSFADLTPEFIAYQALTRKRGKTEKGSAARERLEAKIAAIRKDFRLRHAKWFAMNMARYSASRVGMRERLVRFWADHFTVVGKDAKTAPLVPGYVEEAIRPHIAGKFSDLFRAAALHPMMLHYLDQTSSVGPNSAFAKKKAGRGLNENLAREMIELHSLGVDGDYTQADVRQFAELMAGLTYDPKKGVMFIKYRAEPGPETVLGETYGGKYPTLENIHLAMDRMAAHPSTARHLARKLAVHFVSDRPDAALVDHIAKAYRDSDGDLMACYSALLSHPAAWELPDQKVKQPFDFVGTSLRMFAQDPRLIADFDKSQIRNGLVTPMGMMGQTWEKPRGPDGWPEAPAAWVTPQGIAGRIQWAMTVPLALGAELPDPYEFAQSALGRRVSPALKFATQAAETRWEGVGIVLASPEFQRR